MDESRDVRRVKLPPAGGFSRYEVDTGFEPWSDPPFGRPPVWDGEPQEPFCRAVDRYGNCSGTPIKITLYPHGAALVCAYHGEDDPGGNPRRYEVDKTPIDWARVPDELRADCYRAATAIERQEKDRLEKNREMAANYERLHEQAENQVKRTERWITIAKRERESILEAREKGNDHGTVRATGADGSSDRIDPAGAG